MLPLMRLPYRYITCRSIRDIMFTQCLSAKIIFGVNLGVVLGDDTSKRVIMFRVDT